MCLTNLFVYICYEGRQKSYSVCFTFCVWYVFNFIYPSWSQFFSHGLTYFGLGIFYIQLCLILCLIGLMMMSVLVGALVSHATQKRGAMASSEVSGNLVIQNLVLALLRSGKSLHAGYKIHCHWKNSSWLEFRQTEKVEGIIEIILLHMNNIGLKSLKKFV